MTRTSVVISQGQSKNPVKRKLEEDIVAALKDRPEIDVIVVPHLYDITGDSEGMMAIKQISGHMIVCSWLFERPLHWVLDRNGIQGHTGTVLLTADDVDDDEDEEEDQKDETEEEKETVIQSRSIPDRNIYCLDLKASTKAREFAEEIQRIHDETNVNHVTLNDVLAAGAVPATSSGDTQRFEAGGGRRWYPVIDYSRCTNCMEGIDFCLFGVYGVDRIDTILVEQPDNCRKGCPACSRVCPENAIMFPQHKTPAIAGSNDAAASLKIDLSQLFGAPTDDKSAIDVAAAERDEQLKLAGREAVGLSVGIAKRQSSDRPGKQKPKDELDALVDQLDELDL